MERRPRPWTLCLLCACWRRSLTSGGTEPSPVLSYEYTFAPLHHICMSAATKQKASELTGQAGDQAQELKHKGGGSSP